jgi:uncharacterized NAD-dependent epimerase/dehydratase family protein
MMQYEIPRPYLLFLGEQTSVPHAKTAKGLGHRLINVRQPPSDPPIAGGGIPIDAVVFDFAAGAAELLSPECVGAPK